VALADGSGLSRDNRVTCQAELATVGLGARPKFAALWEGLPVSGQAGTLVDELRGEPLEGKVRAKTGYINGVSGLTGLADVKAPLQFAFFANGGFDKHGAIAERARFASVLATFPDAPPADQLVPAPAASTSP